jgi:diguanylate cyclase (GGDEF)-like protein
MYEVHELKNELEKKNTILKALATTDKLTGIANRNKLDHILEEEYQRTLRFGHPFSILIMDIDYFKKVNDTYGHQTGDQVLKEMASLLNYYIRDTDTVGRWGGEEFMVICPQTNEEGISVLASTLKEKIEEHPFSIVENQTASFGLSTYCPRDDIHSLIQKADKALYRAKKNGRNQVQQL